MSDNESPQVQAIRARYKKSLLDKAEQISGFVNALSELPGHSPDADLADQIHAELHKLAGSLGMYGYDDIAVSARAAMSSAKEPTCDGLLGQLQELQTLLEQHA